MGVEVNLGEFSEAPRALLHRASGHVLRQDSRPTDLSVTLVTDEAMIELNREYLGRDYATDVIAFSLGSEQAPLGDVYLCVDQARRQAADLNVPLEEELVRLTIHGVLHVLGHDHPDGAERAESPMFTLQERLVSEVLALGE